MDVTIIPVTDPTALHCQYPGENRPQPAHVDLDLETGAMTADYNPEIGGGIPVSVFHRRVLRFDIPVTTAAAANQIMEDWKPTAQTILDGARIGWNGHNNVGILTSAASAAADLLGSAMNNGEFDDLPGVDTITADDWYSSVSREEAAANAGITADTTDTELVDTITAEEREAAANSDGDNISVPDGFGAFLRQLRDDLAAERLQSQVEELSETSDQLTAIAATRQTLTETRDRLVRQLAAAGVSGVDISRIADLSPMRISQIASGVTPETAAKIRDRIAAAGNAWELTDQFGAVRLREYGDHDTVLLVSDQSNEVILGEVKDYRHTRTGVIANIPDIAWMLMPPGTHHAVLTAADTTDGSLIERHIVWADRASNKCPRCHEDISCVVDTPPAVLNAGAGPGGQLDDIDQTHSCGQWLTVNWRESTPEGVLHTAMELAENRRRRIAAYCEAIASDLRSMLAAAMARLAEPLTDGETLADREAEIATGSDVEPGVYKASIGWVAWAYGPTSEEPSTITVAAE